MIKQFSVRNYKVFRNEITLDFSKVGGYRFNTDCLSDGMLSKVIIYGRNARGKTSLGEAILDVQHILNPIEVKEDYYTNADSIEKYAFFRYIFVFDGKEVEYRYGKQSPEVLYEEELKLDGKRVFYLNYSTYETDFPLLESIGADGSLNIEKYKTILKSAEKPIPFLRWILNNTMTSKDSILNVLEKEIQGMSASGIKVSADSFIRVVKRTFLNILAETNGVESFERFLNNMGVECKLSLEKLPDDQYELYFKHEKLVPFFETASSGTKELTKMYMLFAPTLINETPSFIYLDEFDAYYHYEMAEKVVRFFKTSFPDTQVVFTTHNTNLMSNQLMRPDALQILSADGKLTAFCDATSRELREGHNLEKMYISGEFEKYE